MSSDAPVPVDTVAVLDTLELARELLAELSRIANAINLFTEIRSLRHALELYKLQVPCDLSPRFLSIEERLTAIEQKLGIE